MIGVDSVWELQIPLLAEDVGVGALVGFVDQSAVRTEIGESGEEERRRRGEKASDEGERIAIVVPPRSE